MRAVFDLSPSKYVVQPIRPNFGGFELDWLKWLSTRQVKNKLFFPGIRLFTQGKGRWDSSFLILLTYFLSYSRCGFFATFGHSRISLSFTSISLRKNKVIFLDKAKVCHLQKSSFIIVSITYLKKKYWII